MSKPQSLVSDPLRAVTTRISSTPTSHLPHVIQHIARSLLDCRTLLSLPESQRQKGSPDAISVHKFKTQVQALVNDKSPSGRYAAVVLIKTTVDVGGHEQLQGCLPWIRGLLSMLNRSTDPPASKRLAMIALTRIFLLTKDYQTLVRELTTPSLPTFITSCLNQVAPKDPPTKPLQILAQQTLLEPVLESFAHLMPNHPNVFRTFLSQINDLIAPLIAPTPSCPQNGAETRQASKDAAQALFTLLPGCAPKQANANSNSGSNPTTTDVWTVAVKSNIDAIHATVDALFRAVHEDWRSFAGVIAQPNAPQSYEGELAAADGVCLNIPLIRASGLPGWSGVHAGGERVAGLLQLLQAFLQGQTSTTVELPVGRIVDVLTRIMSTTAPLPPQRRTRRNARDQMRINPAIGQDERLGLWAELPHIHAAAADTVTILLLRLDVTALPVLDILLEHVLWVFSQESESEPLREALYGALTEMVELSGTSFTKQRTRALDNVVKAACGDVLPESTVTQNASQETNDKSGSVSKKGTTGTINADTLFKTAGHVDQQEASMAAVMTSLQAAAHDFAVTYTNTVPSRHMSAATRALIDRTAVLSGDAEAMLACVMNPPHNESNATKSRSSILPHLARAYPQRLEVEALLRPRMPPVRMGQHDEDDDDDDDDDEEDNESTSPGDEENVGDDSQMQDDAEADAPNGHSQLGDAIARPPSPLLNETNMGQDQGASVQVETRQGGTVSLLGKRNVSSPAPEGESDGKKPRVQHDATPVPVVVADSRGPSQGSHVAVVESSAPVLSSGAAQDSDDDDDNFVMPTLTMEQDTEDEDEDEVAD